MFNHFYGYLDDKDVLLNSLATMLSSGGERLTINDNEGVWNILASVLS